MNIKNIIGGLVVIAVVVVLIMSRGDKTENTKQPGIEDLTFSIQNAQASEVTRFGEPVLGDLDADGDLDAALLLVHQPGGSGSFYYAAFAMLTDSGYEATETVFLGDRIAPQNVRIWEGKAEYNYAVRKPNEPYTTEPSVGVTTYIMRQADGSMGEWVSDFTGESNI